LGSFQQYEEFENESETDIEEKKAPDFSMDYLFYLKISDFPENRKAWSFP
jgi:hypothetical protein